MTSPTEHTQSGLYLASAGSYPRIGDSSELQLLRRAISSLDCGERNTADVLDAENEMTRRAIAGQLSAGIEVITDGQVRWYDPVSHIASKLENVKVAGLQRYFDTNFYFRQPVIVGPLKRTSSLVARDFAFARNVLGCLPTPKNLAGKLSVKPVITGPYTLAKFSVFKAAGNGSVGSVSTLEVRAMAFAEVLAAEVAELVATGAALIQIDEPAIIRHKEDWKIFENALSLIVAARDKASPKGHHPELALCVYFHDCAPLYEKLLALPVDVVCLDFTYSPKLIDVVASSGSPKPLGLGLIDGRNTNLESPTDMARQINRLLPRIQGGRAYLNTSCGLEYLPRDRALAKFELLAKIRTAVESAGA